MHKAAGCKQDQMEQSAEDASLCTQSSSGCPEQLGLSWKPMADMGSIHFWNWK